MVVNSQGKSRLKSEFSLCGGLWAVDMSCMHICPHIYDAMQFELSLYFKIIQGWSTVIWISTMGMECPLLVDVDWHCVVKCGILAVNKLIHDRWVQKQSYKFKLFILQISKIVGCQMVRQEDDLPFDFVHGACNTFAALEEKALLCFHVQKPRECHL